MTKSNKKFVTIYVYAVDPYMGGESIYIGIVVSTLLRLSYVNEIIVLFNDATNRNMIDRKHFVGRISYLKYHPFIKRFDNSLSNKIKKFILFMVIILGLIRLIKKVNIKRIKYANGSLIISSYVAPDLLLFPCKSIVNPQDFRHKYKNKLVLNPFGVLKKIMHSHIYKSVLKNSFIIVDSQYNKRDLNKFYGRYVKNSMIISSIPDFDEIDKIKNNYSDEMFIQIRNKYKLFEEYLFYPAHLIPDNNHLNLLNALYFIEQRYKTKVNVILSGGRDDLKMDILKKVESYKLNVKYLNFISYQELIVIMLNSKGLVFPSFIGPSLPIWEAFYLLVPVCCSNTSAFPEQVRDSSLLFDPENVEDMAEKIYKIWTDENIRKELVKRGYDRIKNLTLENYAKQWERVIEETLDMAERR